MALPEIPDSWFKFLVAVSAFIGAVAASLGVFFTKDNGSGIKVLHDNQQVNSQKLDDVATEAKDANKRLRYTTMKLDSVEDTTGKVADKVGANKE